MVAMVAFQPFGSRNIFKTRPKFGQQMCWLCSLTAPELIVCGRERYRQSRGVYSCIFPSTPGRGGELIKGFGDGEWRGRRTRPDTRPPIADGWAGAEMRVSPFFDSMVTDGPTDRRTDKASYRVACPQLKEYFLLSTCHGWRHLCGPHGCPLRSSIRLHLI